MHKSPGYVSVVRSLDTHVFSSSPPAQSAFPSHAFSIEMNVSEPEQKKYLSFTIFTAGKKQTKKMFREHVLYYVSEKGEWHGKILTEIHPHYQGHYDYNTAHSDNSQSPASSSLFSPQCAQFSPSLQPQGHDKPEKKTYRTKSSQNCVFYWILSYEQI